MRVVTAVLACWAAAASSDAGAATTGPAAVVFDIPAQPLGAALLAYSQVSGAEVFVDDALVAGRRSAPLRGAFEAEAALRKLIAGSGLALRRAAHDAFTLVALTVREPPQDRRPNWSASAAHAGFYAAVQGAVRGVLCGRPDIVPGPYRAALAVWVGHSGAIERARVLTPELDGRTGEVLQEMLRGLAVGPPPAGVSQPLVLVVLPRAPDATGDCAAVAPATRPTTGGG